MLGVVKCEARWFLRSWWSRGHGLAVLALVVVASLLRHDHQLVFWAAIGFFAGHTMTSLRRYVTERRIRSRVLVAIQHPVQSVVPPVPPIRLVFEPRPITSMIDLRVS